MSTLLEGFKKFNLLLYFLKLTVLELLSMYSLVDYFSKCFILYQSDRKFKCTYVLPLTPLPPPTHTHLLL